MANQQPYRIKSISDFHRLRDLPAPAHPLISVVNMDQMKTTVDTRPMVLDYYNISIKRNINGRMFYGQQEYDFNEGVMFFISPNQVFSIARRGNEETQQSGWMLLIHPDFLWNTPLAKTIKQYEYFDYTVHEALFLSEKEEETIAGIVKNIEHEYHSNIDRFSQNIIIAQIELLLNYSERFYQRQFITRKITNHTILNRLEDLLSSYFNDEGLMVKGIPTVQFIAESLNLSTGYLSSLLKALTGQNTQQHIHNKLIEKAKEKLSTTDLTVSEIAYELGFEHSQSFSKLFKVKTSLSPLQFRQSFN